MIRERRSAVGDADDEEEEKTVFSNNKYVTPTNSIRKPPIRLLMQKIRIDSLDYAWVNRSVKEGHTALGKEAGNQDTK